MANTLWTATTGHNLGTYQEAVTQSIPLPVDSSVDTIKLISGSLPGGLRIDGTNLLGTPFEVNRLTKSRFVLRAQKGRRQEDLTLNLTIDGADEPVWITEPGPLPLGPNNRFYILDSSIVDFQLSVIDPDIPAGDNLEYIIEDDGGELPPGLSLGKSTGRITGIVEPLLALSQRANQGFFDSNLYGDFPFDFGVLSGNGFDSYYFDTTFYGYAVPTRSPKKLNRYYQFTVSVSDGVVIAKRQFQIYLVGDDFLRTDNTIMQVATGLFTADNTYLRAPVWLTPSDLGFRRANNYVTLFLDVYDPTSNQGIISFTVKKSNPDGTPSTLPPGMSIDSTTGEIAGTVPFQPAVTKEYKFTVEALRQLGSTAFTTTEFISNNLGVDSGQPDAFPPEDNFSVTDFANDQFIGIEQNGWLVFNETPVTTADAGVNDSVSQARNKNYFSSGIIDANVWVIKQGRVVAVTTDKSRNIIEVSNTDYLRGEYQGVITNIAFKTFDNFGLVTSNKAITVSFYSYQERITDTKNPIVSKDKTFTVKLLGEVESAITWNTLSDLGNLRANFVSTLNISATSNVPNAIVLYTLDSGRLPPGITLAIDGQLQGKVRQFGEPGKPGLTTIDKLTTPTTFDGGDTTIDRSYTFTVKAQDQFQFSATTREFTITTTDPDDTLYSSISMIPLLPKTQRNLYRNFISDPTIFTPESIFRPNDETFGIQPDMKMLAYAGIETKHIREFVAASAKNHRRKQYKLGEVQKALAKKEGSNDIVYEVIYVEVIDPQEPIDGTRTAKSFSISTKNKVTVDSIQYAVTDDNTGEGTGEGFFDVGLRGGDGRSPASTGTIIIFTRTGPALFTAGKALPVVLQSGQTVTVADIDDSINADPLRLRPITNTIKVDSDAVSISDSNDRTKYISNITNMRDRIREVGNNLRSFYPLWMRTPQIQGEAELGYKLAVPLCYCKPGEADQIMLNIKNSNFDFKAFKVEIERYNIDATDGNSNEQYIPFANYQFNV